jgi:tRNA-dihydrouridine synthase 1
MASEMRSEMATTTTASTVLDGIPNAETKNDGGADGVEGGSRRRKLHGRAFYESIGSPKLVLAPMVEQSEFVRRQPRPA